MTTFSNGESGLSVRNKINDTINKVDGVTPITSVNIDSGSIDGTVIGGSSAAAGTFTTATATTGNITTVNATTVDTTNIEVTNIKAKDGTASATIADSTGVMTIASSVLTTTDINGGTIDGVTIGGSTPAAISGTTITAAQYDSTEALPDIKPSLNLDFANVKKLDPRITFTRASTGAYYDGVTFAKAEENLLLQSQDFTTTWANTRSTDSANTETAPDGTLTADSVLQASGETNGGVIQQAVNVSALDYVISVFAKPNGKDFLRIVETAQTGSTVITWFDVSTGAVGTTGSGHTASISASTNGFYRCSVKFTANAARSGTIFFGLADTDGSTTVADDTNGLYLWGAQLEQRDALTDYTPTTTQPITNYVPALQTAASGEARFDHDPLTGESLGFLIEEQRTNLATYSEDFADAAWTKTRSSITSNIVVAPDGTLTGDKLVEDTTASSTHDMTVSASFTSGTAYTLSIYAKQAGRNLRIFFPTGVFGAAFSAVFNLSEGTATIAVTGTVASITNVGNGWYRCSITQTATASSTGTFTFRLIEGASTTSYTGDGYSGVYIWGAQLEEGAFPTSYIKTVASQATRNADAASMTGTNFSQWYRQDEGTLFFVGTSTLSPSNHVFGGVSNGVFANSVYLIKNNLNSLTVEPNVAPTNIEINLGSYDGTETAVALGLGQTSASASRDGGAVVTDSSIYLQPANVLSIGRAPWSSSNFINGHMRKLAYYPKRLSDATLQSLTEE